MSERQYMAQERERISENMRKMDENQFVEFMNRMAQERQRMGANARPEIVDELPKVGDPDTVYFILRENQQHCSDLERYNVYQMYHFHPEAEWLDWGGLEVLKEDIADFNSACEYAEDSLDDVISDVLETDF